MKFGEDLSIFCWGTVQLFDEFLCILEVIDDVPVPLLIQHKEFSALVVDALNIESGLQRLFLTIHKNIIWTT